MNNSDNNNSSGPGVGFILFNNLGDIGLKYVS